MLDQLFLGRYVPVQGHRRSACLGRYPAHGNRVQPFRVRDPDRGLDDPRQGKRRPGALARLIADPPCGGETIFLTTQYLEEADKLADRIALLNGGRLVAEGTPAELKQRVSEKRLEVHLAGTAEPLTLPTDGSAAQVRALLDQLDPSRRLIQDFAVHGASLDDVFLALTQEVSLV